MDVEVVVEKWAGLEVIVPHKDDPSRVLVVVKFTAWPQCRTPLDCTRAMLCKKQCTPKLGGLVNINDLELE